MGAAIDAPRPSWPSSSWRCSASVTRWFPCTRCFVKLPDWAARPASYRPNRWDGKVDTERLVTVEFSAVVNSGLPWEVAPAVSSLKVHPGKVYAAHFVARNFGGGATVGRAVPNVVPNAAARYFDKTECFCFQEQHLTDNQPQDMPLRFIISKDLPRDIGTVTLSYTFFNAGRQT